ncbi:MAG: hypothetical protein OXU70_04205 [Gammaproteobacteria bacterium]|nr:hypothetical protein [Gammaproteobacteria bacterium]
MSSQNSRKDIEVLFTVPLSPHEKATSLSLGERPQGSLVMLVAVSKSEPLVLDVDRNVLVGFARKVLAKLGSHSGH